jgi:hypothetical protein
MNMQEPALFGATTNTRTSEWASSWLMIFGMLVVQTGFNAWGIGMVGKGIIGIQLIPPDWPTWCAYAFAGGLQSIITFFGFVTPLFFKMRRPTDWFFKPILFSISCIIVFQPVSFEVYHSVYAQLKNSTGAGSMKTEATIVASLQSQVTTISAQIPSIYSGRLQGLDDLAKDSEAGRDKSGIAGCKKICKGYRIKRAEIIEKYGHLSVNPVAIQSTSPDIRVQFTDLSRRFQSLTSFVASLDEFSQAMNGTSAPLSITNAVTKLGEEITKKGSDYSEINDIDAANVTLIRTNEVFAAIKDLKLPRTDSRLPFVYGVLPPLCVLVLAIWIRIAIGARRGHSPLHDVHDELAVEKEAADILDSLSSIREKNHKNWLRSQFRKWGG